jgi:hypothetical protein
LHEGLLQQGVVDVVAGVAFVAAQIDRPLDVSMGKSALISIFEAELP